MELSSSLDLIAPVLQIVLLDLLLSGDNAVVIALVSRQLPVPLRRRAVIWGTVAAIAFRVLLTFTATLLLRAPLLKIAGALMLLMIGIELMADNTDEDSARRWFGRSADNVVRAILLIVGADAAMSLDNVVAVAAAAQDQLAYLVFGLILSIPILVFASLFVARLIDSHPWLVDAGAALLGWVAGRLAVTDPAVADALATQSFGLVSLAPILGAGYVWVQGNLRRQGRQTRSSASARLAPTLALAPVPGAPAIAAATSADSRRAAAAPLPAEASARLAPALPLAHVPAAPALPPSAPAAPPPVVAVPEPEPVAEAEPGPQSAPLPEAGEVASNPPAARARGKSGMDMVILAGVAIPALGLIVTLIYIIGRAISRHA